VRAQRQETTAAYLFLAPFLITLFIFFVYATVQAILYSFTNYDLFQRCGFGSLLFGATSPEEKVCRFVGLRNYSNLFQQELFVVALRNSLLFSAIVTMVQTFGALVMASVLNQRIRGLNFFRAAFYMPSVTSSVVITLIFLWMYQTDGLFNYLATQIARHTPQLLCLVLVAAGLQVIQVLLERKKGYPARWGDPALLMISLLVGLAVTWLLSFLGILIAREAEVEFIWLQTRLEIPTFLPEWLRSPVPLIAIMIQNIFTTIPTFMLMFLAALQDVPKSHYEAASLDGATAAQQFRHITIPAVQPVTFLVITLSLIGTLQMFDQVAIFGNAVPQRSVITLAYFVYTRMFPGAQLPEVGFASAAAMFLALLTLTIVLIQRRFVRSEAT
jgi:multiple sugar transport system permease protein